MFGVGGEVSFAALEKDHQLQQRKQEDIRSLQQQIHQLQVRVSDNIVDAIVLGFDWQLSRDALLEEVSYLSARNSELQDQLKGLPTLQDALANARKRVDLLLVMLGEKEEELEAAVCDMKEVKYLYRTQLDELLIAAAARSVDGNYSEAKLALPLADVDK